MEYKFLDENGTFCMDRPENNSDFYFPIAAENGIKSAVTPNWGGDSKWDQNHFLLEPVSVENLHNNRSSRNFWCQVKGIGNWSVTGVSAEANAAKFTDCQEESQMEAGYMWQTTRRSSKKYQLQSEVTMFAPEVDEDFSMEVMQVKVTNIGRICAFLTPVAAVPIYGRSADNIRDHRHVTSLLHRISTMDCGVEVTPTMSFDERGHQENYTTYFVCGVTGEGGKPKRFYPTLREFIGEGGNLERPRALIEKKEGHPAGASFTGEAFGGIKFEEICLEPGETASYTIFLGICKGSGTREEKKEKIAKIIEKYKTEKLVEEAFLKTKEKWKNQVNVHYHTGEETFDQFLNWVSFQPILRRIYGCSFLPHHDYGKGGRGWRDLWQDCLALLIMSPTQVRKMLLDNFGGVRIDGTNATIIGEKQGEFVADRNNITRVWMDHGVWPLLTTNLYLEQTGDFSILEEKVPYFKDKQIVRGTKTDEEWKEGETWQQTKNGEIYYGSVLEHLLIQHLTAFYEVGEHNEILLRGADWNDALDMASKRGESVAYTNAYAGNLKSLASIIRYEAKRTGKKQLLLWEEIERLLEDNKELYESVSDKKKCLDSYLEQGCHFISGKRKEFDAEDVATGLEHKADWMMEHIRKTEWVTDAKGNGWFNGYYDDHGRMVEGKMEQGVRMMLTSQVFSIMAGTATDEQVRAITKSADTYLFEKEIGGYRLNTDFKEVKMDLGRMFGFAYGEKENGAVFSHMAVMYANALYQRGFVEEGYKALKALEEQAMNPSVSHIYPGIPEYFNSDGKGLYHYLTGAASWYMLTVITQMFGVRGEKGALKIAPKLKKEQFDAKNEAKITLPFGGKNWEICLKNQFGAEYGTYQIKKAVWNQTECQLDGAESFLLTKEEIEQAPQNNVIEIWLS
ncbi:GH36-type glycosyl hydrolase domain-containing protein [Roseburia sp. 831b]|uniref:GH36-type glycosyl hydrolase domain-containing protein n=1 Tax=Roseburia sp. 831b TaxID=1261635 RepID=UPI0009536563|nr:cellobiose phosphorylase [Roseburia sp. 831b]MDY5882685.1 cellobiose phosphorylase [Roseburia sp.]WVK73619.1 cellobiose phosphorylase [Roseburia sp. 831b]